MTLCAGDDPSGAQADALRRFNRRFASRGLHARLLPEGYVPTQTERLNHSRAEAVVRAGLTDDVAYRAAYAEGGGLTLEEATALLQAYLDEQ